LERRVSRSGWKRFWLARLALAVVALLVGALWPRWGPLAVAIALVAAAPTLGRAWRGAWGTALRPVVMWTIGTWALTLAAQLFAMGEPASGGRPWCGHLTYLASLAGLASAVALLNARRPGEGAWALLTVLLVLVLLIPWLEGSGLARRPSAWSRLRLEAPWSIFYVLLVAMAVGNHLPTRFGGAAFVLGGGWTSVFIGLQSPPSQQLATLWSWWGGSVAGALVLAGYPYEVEAHGRPRPAVERLWSWFRDRWGVVWGLRVQERFNRTAEAAGWPIRLAWHGLAPASGATEVPDAALPTLVALLGRFATRARLDEVAAGAAPCGSSVGDRS
jgi:hypothetical protein